MKQGAEPSLFSPTRWVLPVSIFLAGMLLVSLSEFLRLPSVDLAVAERTNRLIGHSSTYDLTLTFLTEDSGDFFGMLAFVLLMGRTVFRHGGPRANLASVSAYLILGACLSVVIYELIDYLGEAIHRPTPGATLPSFALLDPAYDPDVDVKAFDSFPSKRGALYSLPFLLAVLRYQRIPLKHLLLPLVFCAPHILVGSVWLSDVLGGFVLSWIVVASFASTRLHDAYLRLERQAESAYEEYVIGKRSEWIALGIAKLTHRTAPFGPSRSDEEEDESGVTIAPELTELLREQWSLELLRQAGPPHKGKLFRLQCDSGEYAFKISRVRSKRAGELEEKLGHVDLMRRDGIVTTPRVIPVRSGELTTVHGNQTAYLMEWIEGRHIRTGSLEEVGALMRALAHFHASTEGTLTDAPATHSRVLEVVNDMRQRSEVVLTRFSEERSTTDRGDATVAGLRRLAEEAVRAEVMARMSLLYAFETPENGKLCLCHHDTHPMNCMIADDETLYLLDFDRMGPGLGCEDLFTPMKKLVERHQWRFSAFEGVLAEYLAVRPLSRAEISLLLAYLFYPDRALKGMSKDLDAGRRGRTGKYTIRVFREGMLSASVEGLRRRFLYQAIRRYNIPMLGLTLPPEKGDGLRAWIDAG